MPPEPPQQQQVLPSLHVAVFGSAAKVRPEGAVQGPADARLVAGRNELESFQIAVNGAARGVEVTLASPFQGPGGAAIAGENVTIYRVGYVALAVASDPEGAPGRWPDPLIPVVDPLVGEARSAFPIDVPAGENRVAWVDVHVPPDATPGVYRASVELRADGFASTVPVELTVLPFTLPSTPTLRSAFGLSDHACEALGSAGCSSDADENARLRSLFVRLALDNRITIGRPHTPLIPPGGEPFRTWLLPFLHGTAETRLAGARLTTFQVNQVSDRNVAPWREEAEAQGFADRAFVWSCDEPHFFPTYGDPAGNWPPCIARIEQDDAAWPGVPKLVTAHIQTVERYAPTAPIDILVVNVEFLHGPEGGPWFAGDQRPLYDAWLAQGDRELWLYSACGSHGCTRNDDPYTRGWAGGYEIDAPAAQTRALPWLAFVYAMDGLLYYDTTLALATAWDDPYRHTGNGDGTLFYPGTPDRIGGATPIPVESIRLKNLRDGFEDYEWLEHLRAKGGGAAEALRIARAHFPAPFDTSRTDEEVQRARRELLERAVE